MPSLTHVRMFSEHGWRKIDVSEAIEQFPSTVHVKSKMLMCELCHQYVTFTRPGTQDRHFRHRPDEDKSCPERTFAAGASTNCSIKEHDLPIRIRHTSTDFTLEMGLLGVPEFVLKELKNQTIQISPIGKKEPTFFYRLKERLREDQVTYVPIGSIPFQEYRIQLDCRNLSAFSFWPQRIRGIEPEGTLFDAVSGKKIPYDADIQIQKPYLLLRVNPIASTSSSVSLQKIMAKSAAGRCWYLYRISANVLDKAAAKFFLELHCRLTDHPVSIQPIWPLYTKGPYAIHHNNQEMVFYVRGDVTTKCYPLSYQSGEQIEDRGRIEFIRCVARQQLISAGHEYQLAAGSLQRRLKYTYLWQEPLDNYESLPSISVTNLTGQDVLPGLADRLPPQGILRVSAPYDGLVIIRKQGRVIEKRRLKAEVPCEISPIRFDYELEIIQGLDRVWSIQYQRKHRQTEDEALILQRLNRVSGSSVPVSHEWGAAAEYLEDYPHVKQWLYQRIRKGYMSVAAHHELRCLIARLTMK